MSLTVQNVMDDVSFELRKDLDATSGSGDAFDLMLKWVDLTHKDMLHRGVYRHALRTTTSVTTLAGTDNYALTPTNIRRIEAVYNNKLSYFLSPIGEAMAPSSLADMMDKGGTARPERVAAALRASGQAPEFFWLRNIVTTGVPAYTLFIFPAPESAEFAGTMTLYYIKQATTVAAAGTALDALEDSRDAMQAGVLWRAYSYLGNMPKAAYWQQVWESMVVGETI